MTMTHAHSAYQSGGSRGNRRYGAGSALLVLKDALGDAVTGPNAARCPAHEDQNASLAFSQGDRGAVLHCHAGCDTRDILAALGLDMADLFDDAPTHPSDLSDGLGDIEYPYTDACGHLLYTVVRKPNKRFLQRAASGVWSMAGVTRVPYRLPDLLAAVSLGERVWVVEGEKDVEALIAAGEVATTNSGGGSAKWPTEFAEHFIGADVTIVADRDEVGRRHAEDVRISLTPVASAVRIVEAKIGNDAADHLAVYGVDDFVAVERVSPRAATTRRLVAKPAQGVEMRATRWLWKTHDGKGLIPRGEMTLVQGFEGVSKSTLALDLGASVTRGVLPGDLHGRPGGVLILATEDSFEKTILPRLAAARADMARIYTLNVEEGNGEWGVMELRRDCEELAQIVEDNGIAVLILDPLISRLGKADTHKDSEVRQQLEPLVRMADQTGAAVIGLIHYNKNEGGDRRNKTMGSRAFTAVTRAVLDVIEDATDPAVKLVALSKANLGSRDVPSYRYRLEGVAVGIDSEDDTVITAPHVIWDGEDSRTIDDLMEESRDRGEGRSKLREAIDWLSDILTIQGRTPSASIKRMAKVEGITEGSLDRAKTSLRVTVRSVALPGKPRTTEWALPDGVEPSGESSQ